MASSSGLSELTEAAPGRQRSNNACRFVAGIKIAYAYRSNPPWEASPRASRREGPSSSPPASCPGASRQPLFVIGAGRMPGGTTQNLPVFARRNYFVVDRLVWRGRNWVSWAAMAAR